MALHESTFEYLKPTTAQVFDMQVMREAAKAYAEFIEQFVPDGPDKTVILRQFRLVAMQVNVAITREADGTPRD